MIGTALGAGFRRDGHEVIPLRRSCEPAHSPAWFQNSETGQVEVRLDEGVDVVVHLAGENLARGRWTGRRKVEIRESRVQGTGAIAKAIAGLTKKPRVVIGASATGYYGDRGEEECTEESSPGSGFLAEVCEAWEAAWSLLSGQEVRVVRLRIGMVLASEGGALARVLPVFRLGLGGVLGSGLQYWSWIHLEDLVRVVMKVVEDEALSGAVNATSPDPVTNRTFTRELAAVLRRRAWLPVPQWGLRCLLGEMADELLLSGARVIPQKLQGAGFRFDYPSLSGALESVARQRA
jgi:uncharacterized protein (TIGR01777 family)